MTGLPNSWLAEYLHEMTVFPKGKHDDQVDSTAQFLDWFKTPRRAGRSMNFIVKRLRRWRRQSEARNRNT